jgi:hypothetical protein
MTPETEARKIPSTTVGQNDQPYRVPIVAHV